MSKTIIAIIIVIIVVGLGYWFYQSTLTPEEESKESLLTKEEALTIAQAGSDCSMAGVLTDEINYNANTKTWWIDLERMPELENDGCNPACVVSEETKTAEVNWRCTGLLPLETEEAVKNLLAAKYGKDISEVTIDIWQETTGHIKGGVQFQPGGSENSGMFLVAKVNNEWELAHDGQGAVPCLVAAQYNFPADMVKECVGGDGTVEDRREEFCLKSGGQLTTSLCCGSTEDYPNLCLVGPYGCSPENSHQVKICNCGNDKCFNGNECVILENK